MSREEFIELCEQLRLFITPDNKLALYIPPNYRVPAVAKRVALTLYFLKDTEFITMTANTFGLHQSTVSKVVMEVCNAVVTYLASYIPLPRQKMKCI